MSDKTPIKSVFIRPATAESVGKHFVQPLSGLMNHFAVTQGSPALRANPGLNDGTPLEF